MTVQSKCFATMLSLASVFCLSLARSAEAQNQPNTGGISVFVIDIGYVFKNYKAFNSQYESIKGEIDAFEQSMNSRRKQILEGRKQLAGLRADSPEYKAIEQRIAHEMSDLQVEMGLKRKEVLQREAKINFDAYQAIQAKVKLVADHYGASLVLRHDAEPIDPQNRNSVLKGLNRHVVFQKNLDITHMVLQQLDPTWRPPSSVAGGNTGTQTK